MSHRRRKYFEQRRKMVQKMLSEMSPEEYREIEERAQVEVKKIKEDIAAKRPKFNKDGY